jgi:3-dehydroquinate synthetase
MINLTGNTFRSKDIDFADFDQLIYRSVEIKNEIVTIDPKERISEKHSILVIGHAIESYFLESQNKTTLLHGGNCSRNDPRKLYFLEETAAINRGIPSN